METASIQQTLSCVTVILDTPDAFAILNLTPVLLHRVQLSVFVQKRILEFTSVLARSALSPVTTVFQEI
jgi:hypothetical protein